MKTSLQWTARYLSWRRQGLPAINFYIKSKALQIQGKSGDALPDSLIAMVPSEETERDDQIQDGVESDECNVSSNVYVRMLVQDWWLMNTNFFTERPLLWSYTGYHWTRKYKGLQKLLKTVDLYLPISLWIARRHDFTLFGVVEDTTGTKFAGRACAVHCNSIPSWFLSSLLTDLTSRRELSQRNLLTSQLMSPTQVQH